MSAKTRAPSRTAAALLALALAAFTVVPLPAVAATRLAAALTASSTNPGYGVGNAGDGNQSSYWESTNNQFPQWVQADLGAAKPVSRVVLRLPASWEARTQTLVVQASATGGTFSDVVASRGHVFTPTSNNTVTLDFPATTARYVRVTITANTGWPAGQLSELEVHGEDTGTPPPDGTDLARGKAIEASSSVFDFVAANANDGNVGTYWESNGYPSTLTVKLGANADLSSVVVKLNPDPVWGSRTQNLEVLGRDQGATGFTALKARADHRFDPASGNTVTIPVTGRAADVRLQFFGNTGAPGGQVAELQVFGTAAPNPDLTVPALTWAPASPSEADAITLSATVRNTGNAAAAATTVGFSLGGTSAGTAQVPALAAGAQAAVTVDAGRRAAGTHTATATVDPANSVAEQNEMNNSTSTSITVGQAPGPDLQVIAVTPNPQSPAVGAPVTFAVQVHNRGTSAAATSLTRVTVGGSTLTATTPQVNAGQTVTVNVGTWTATSGGATINATADAGNAVAETNESNNSLTQSIVVGRGAAVPWVSYEAEAGRYQGTLLESDPLRTFGHTNFATESSGRKSVRLTGQGQFVEITSTISSNSIVVRNSIPDAAGGGGIEATISLYANDQFVQKLTLSSRHSWLYGSSDDPEGLTNRPAGDARRLFDETSALLPSTYPSGTRFKLQRDAGDTALFYIIDLVDLEQVAPASSQPDGCVSITQYGAVPNDNNDDTAALQRAVTDDQNGVIPCVWIPAGRWRQEQKILTDDPQNRGQWNQVGIRDVSIRGAGMWHSQFFTLTEPQNVVGGINHPHEGNFGFDIDDNVQISDIAIFGSGRIRGGDGNAEGGVGLNGRFGRNTKITNVWIEHANVGVWVGRDFDNIPELWGPADGLKFSGVRVRNTYADGINLTNGARNSEVFNSSFRTTGDDALAIWANPRVKDTSVDITHDNRFLNNTVQLPWRANGIAVYGGYNNRIENNLVYDTMNYPGIMLATDHDPLPFSGQTLIAGNGLYRTGGAFWSEQQKFGAITLFAPNRDITGVTIRDTDIVDSTYDGIQFKGGGGAMPNVAITNVRIDRSNNGAGILAQGSARGSATLTAVTITNSATGDVVVEPGSQFAITRAATTRVHGMA